MAIPLPIILSYVAIGIAVSVIVLIYVCKELRGNTLQRQQSALDNQDTGRKSQLLTEQSFAERNEMKGGRHHGNTDQDRGQEAEPGAPELHSLTDRLQKPHHRDAGPTDDQDFSSLHSLDISDNESYRQSDVESETSSATRTSTSPVASD